MALHRGPSGQAGLPAAALSARDNANSLGTQYTIAVGAGVWRLRSDLRLAAALGPWHISAELQEKGV